ncbi:MAG: DNA-binding protein [Mediterranea sp.]|jgi:predicted histone-like DNA-binding protein|nr:DNA-binding protein [Mediterranea sp.]
MSAFYDFRKLPTSPQDEQQTLYPDIVTSGTVKTDKLIQEISEATAFTLGDLKGVLTALAEKVSYYLAEGFNVELGEMGYLSLSLTSRPVKDAKKIRSRSILLSGVNFRASVRFRRKIAARMQLERAPKGFGFRESALVSEEERKRRLMDYLKETPYITRTEYTRITGLLKKKALADLNKFTQQGMLERRGRGSSLIFVRAK